MSAALVFMVCTVLMRGQKIDATTRAGATFRARPLEGETLRFGCFSMGGEKPALFFSPPTPVLVWVRERFTRVTSLGPDEKTDRLGWGAMFNPHESHDWSAFGAALALVELAGREAVERALGLAPAVIDNQAKQVHQGKKRKG